MLTVDVFEHRIEELVVVENANSKTLLHIWHRHRVSSNCFSSICTAAAKKAGDGIQ
jgi:hypothetical protein